MTSHIYIAIKIAPLELRRFERPVALCFRAGKPYVKIGLLQHRTGYDTLKRLFGAVWALGRQQPKKRYLKWVLFLSCGVLNAEIDYNSIGPFS